MFEPTRLISFHMASCGVACSRSRARNLHLRQRCGCHQRQVVVAMVVGGRGLAGRLSHSTATRALGGGKLLNLAGAAVAQKMPNRPTTSSVQHNDGGFPLAKQTNSTTI